MPTWIIPAPTGPTTGLEVVELIVNLTNWLFVGFMVLAAVFVVLAAWQFISSSGEPVAVAQARAKLLWAAIAIGVAVLSRGIVAVIGKIIIG